MITPIRVLCLSVLAGVCFLTLAASQTPLDASVVQPGSSLWQRTQERRVSSRGRRLLSPARSTLFELDTAAFRRVLARIPAESAAATHVQSVVIDIPMPDGTLASFRIEDSPILAPHLSTDFPTWRTLQGYGLTDPTATARFDWTAKGFHGYIISAMGTVYIDPLQENDTRNYIVYYKHEYGRSLAGEFACRLDDRFSSSPGLGDLDIERFAPAFSNGNAIRTYRIAVATTGEWARGTTVATDPIAVRTSALAAITTSLNRLDGIYRRELAVALVLVNPPIDNEMTNIIFDDPATDPYDNTDSEAQLNINQTTVTNRVATTNFDIGHLYGTGGGGIAATPSVCDASNKAMGYSARAGFYGDPFTVDYVAHELGHQFGANHTYNNADPSGPCTTRSSQNAFEVASGVTIMSYVGICSNRNLQQLVETGFPSFHARSLTEMVANLQNGEGNTCGQAAPAANSVPTINPGAAFTIPVLTPFTLTATGSDADAGDLQNLLYSWEQYDLAPSASGVMGAPANTFDVDTDGVLRPLFRSYSPAASPSRTFPSIAFVLNPTGNNPAGSNNPALTYTGTHPTAAPGAVCETGATCVMGESLPSVARTMNFRVTVRDRRGGISDAATTVTTANTGGAFQVTSQNETPAAWPAGSTQTVTWNVAGTNSAPINVANVNVLLSIDGGQTFPTTLLGNTPNDGTENVTVPSTATNQTRIKVEAAGNIFFDINNASFAITGAPPAVVIGDGRGTEGGGASMMPLGADSVDFSISLSAPSAQPVTVRVSTSSVTATEGVDFVSLDNFDVVFPANTLTRTASVLLIEDSEDEGDETFTLDLVSVVNASIGDGQGIGTVVDNDPAVEGSVAGRVTTPDNRDLSNASVAITDSTGVRRTTVTNSFGFYSFAGVRLNQSVTIKASSRRFRFAARQIQVTGDLQNVNFVGLQ
ncbi:MAG: reprolysin-like metallopeptidase [Pyrinomonadaceae bacterium]